MRAGVVVSLLLALVVIGGGGSNAIAQEVETTTEAGVHTTTFTLPEGEVLVFLPADVAAGDRVSGAVYVTAAGESDNAVARNRAKLRNYVLEVGDWAMALDNNGTLSLLLPEGDGVLDVTVMSVKRRIEVANATVLLAKPVGPTPDTYEIPTLGQTGRYLQITGPFDGELSTSRCSVGGLDALPLAESPRRAVFVSPEGIVGKLGVELRQDDTIVATGTYRSVDVQVTADDFSLERDEVTMLWVDVAGLGDLDEPVDLDIHIGPPSIVLAEGGNRQTLTILPANVREDGRYVHKLKLTGQQPGSWNAVATVVTAD